jgi:hypothetical protein
MTMAADKRRFRLLDAMIMVAATAAGCALLVGIDHFTQGEVSCSAVYRSSQELFGDWPAGDWEAAVAETAELALLIACLLMPVAAIWTLALVSISFTGPRPPLRRLARQPGVIAVCAAGLSIVCVGFDLLMVALSAHMKIFGQIAAATVLVPVVPMFIGWGVLIAWSTLLLGRRWRAEPIWIDRLGRATGVFWIVGGFAVTGLFLLSPIISVCPARAINANTPAALGPGNPPGPLPLEP